MWDVAIVGGGPSGLTAAIHLVWHRRRVVVLDRATGPLFFTLEKLWNVPGLPGATGVEIQKRLKAQAVEQGAVVERASVARAGGAVVSQRGDTNVPGVWVAGDLRPMTQQVAVAMGTGNVAAVMIDQYLRKRDIAAGCGG